MVIKYRCWDKKKHAWRTPDPDNMVSMFTPGTRNAMRIIAPENYTLVLWTGFEDCNGNDVYPGDILDTKHYVNWDILAGKWSVYKRGSDVPVSDFSKFRPHDHEITGTIFEEDGTEEIS